MLNIKGTVFAPSMHVFFVSTTYICLRCFICVCVFLVRAMCAEVDYHCRSGVPNQSIAIYWSIFKCLAVDRGWFYACI